LVGIYIYLFIYLFYLFVV